MKKNKVFKIALSILIMSAMGAILNSCGQMGIKYEVIEKNGNHYISHVQTGKQKEVVIPSRYEGKDVRGITSSAFLEYTSMTSLTLPNSLVEIDGFYGCENLEDIYFNGTVEDWMNIEFLHNPMKYAENLYFLDENGSVRKNGKKYSLITEINISEKLRVIGDYTFYGCNQITSVIIPEGIIEIGTESFYGCDKLETIEIPSSVREIGRGAFENCNGLKIIKLPFVGKSGIDTSTMNSGFGYIFGSNGGLENRTKIPPSLEKVIIYNCNRIYNNAFAYCVNLKEVFVSKSVVYMGNYVFDGCSSLTVYLEVESQPITWSDQWNNGLNSYLFNITEDSLFFEKDELFYVVSNNEATLIKYEGDKSEVIVPDSININGTNYQVTIIGKSAFANNKNLRKVVLPNNVKVIEKYAFDNCENLMNVEVGNNLEKIGEFCFRYCKSLLSMELPETICELGMGAFMSCFDLVRVNIPNKITSIEERLFSSCESLIDIVVPKGVTKIGKQAFFGCCSLKNITIPSEILNIGSEAFSYLPETVYNAYENGLYLGNEENPYLILVTVKNVEASSFIIHKNTKIIYYHAFYNCSLLKEIEIPDNVYLIGRNAFECCYELSKVKLGNKLNTILEGAFCSCNKLIQIVIPESVEVIGQSAFTVFDEKMIYCERSSMPDGWADPRGHSSSQIYWKGQWTYVNGVPTPIISES